MPAIWASQLTEDKNPYRIKTAFSILLSLPRIPIIYYGDKVGVANNFSYNPAQYTKNLLTKNKKFKKRKTML